MATRKKNEKQDLPKKGPHPNPKDVSDSTANQENVKLVDVQSQQISELQSLTKSLIETVKNIQTESARDLAYYEALSDVKSATKALLVSQSSPKQELSVPRDQQNIDKNCESPCGCVSNSCCSFDIIMTEIRVSSMQNEIPGDSNVGAMEIRVFAHIDGIGAVIPGMFSTLNLHKPIGNPALWTTVNTKIREVTVPKNISKAFIIKVDGKEVEHTITENVAFIRDEHGSASGTISLNCCCQAPVIQIELPFTAGGAALANRGSIEARFSAIKKCC